MITVPLVIFASAWLITFGMWLERGVQAVERHYGVTRDRHQRTWRRRRIKTSPGATGEPLAHAADTAASGPPPPDPQRRPASGLGDPEAKGFR